MKAWVAVFVVFAMACTEDKSGVSGESGDGGAAADGGQQDRCDEDADCDDGRFCNGLESCEDGSCQPGDEPCLRLQTCREGARACETNCDSTLDADGDGFDSVDCGGSDCDDSNANRYPGNAEVCDENDLDEDCDDATFGTRDVDQDGFVDAACCNGDLCGEDCDDKDDEVRPGEVEVCDGKDNNCNGVVDDAAPSLYPEWYADADGDGARATGSEPILECVLEKPGFTLSGTSDCDDSDPQNYSGNDEVCDGQDNDCDEATHACAYRADYATPVLGSQVESNVLASSTTLDRLCPQGMALRQGFYSAGTSNSYSLLRLACAGLNYDPSQMEFSWGELECLSLINGDKADCNPVFSPCAEGALPIGLDYDSNFRDFSVNCTDEARFSGTEFEQPIDGDCPAGSVVVGVRVALTNQGDPTSEVWPLCASLLAREY